MRSVLVDGPDQCVYAVRRLLREGADLVKIVTATGNMGQPYDNMKFRACFNLKEIRAMSDEAHEQGKKIAAHVVGDVGLRNALDGGIDMSLWCLTATRSLTTPILSPCTWRPQRKTSTASARVNSRA